MATLSNINVMNNECVEYVPYSAKFWRGNILADLADSLATAKISPSKIICYDRESIIVGERGLSKSAS